MTRFSMIVGGAALVIFGVFLEISWLAVCFGTIILGIVLLIFAPHILFFPFVFFALPGAALFLGGLFGTPQDASRWKNSRQNDRQNKDKNENIIDVEIVG